MYGTQGLWDKTRSNF